MSSLVTVYLLWVFCFGFVCVFFAEIFVACSFVEVLGLVCLPGMWGYGAAMFAFTHPSEGMEFLLICVVVIGCMGAWGFFL